MQVGWSRRMSPLTANDPSASIQQTPVFSLLESFKRYFGVVQREKSIEASMTNGEVEEFDFSRAASIFSSGLTKAQVYICFRLIVQVMGEFMQLKRDTLSIDFEVGTLTCGNGEVSFRFNPSIKDREKFLDSDSRVSRSSYFSIKESVKASSSRSSHSSHSEKQLQSKQEIVYNEALSRYIDKIEKRTSQLISEKNKQEENQVSLQLKDQMEVSCMRRRNQEYLEYLSGQIRENKYKRKQEEKKLIESASCHDFPRFNEESLPPSNRRNAKKIQSDLAQQVQEKRAREASSRRNEFEYSRQLNTVNLSLIRAEKEAENRKKSQQMRILKQSWDQYCRLKACLP